MKDEKVIKYKNRIVFSRVTSPYFGRVPKQYVENEACFIFVNQGEFSVRAQNTYLSLNQEKGLLAKCLNYFYEADHTRKKNSDCIEVVGVILYPSLIKELFEFDLTLSTYSLDFNLKQVAVDRLLANFKEGINILIDNPELADEQMIKLKLKEFVLMMTRFEEAPSQLDFLAALFKPNNVEFQTIIRHNLYANLSLDELAALAHLSLSSFKRKFKETFGESPKKYIAKKKIEKAAELLKSGNLRVSDIAYDVGFDSIVTFNRNFSKFYDKSPSEYRLNQTDKPLG